VRWVSHCLPKFLESTLYGIGEGYWSNRIADADTKLSKLQDFSLRISENEKLSSSRASLERQVLAAETQLGNLEASGTQAESDFQTTEEVVARALQSMRSFQDRIELINWVREQKPIFSKLSEQLLTVESELEELQAALDTLQAEADQQQRLFSSHEAISRQAAERLTAKQRELAVLRNQETKLQSRPAISSRLEELSSLITENESSIVEQHRLENELGVELRAVEAEGARLARVVEEAVRNQTELRKLLTQLQGHVTDGVCPLCGDDHGSKEELIGRMQTRISTDSGAEETETLRSMRAQFRRLSEQLARTSRSRVELQTRLVEFEKEAASLESQLAELEQAASAVGFDPSSSQLDRDVKERADILRPHLR
jgi:exonuclease SbcC